MHYITWLYIIICTSIIIYVTYMICTGVHEHTLYIWNCDHLSTCTLAPNHKLEYSIHMIGYLYVHVPVHVCTPQYRVLAQYSTHFKYTNWMLDNHCTRDLIVTALRWRGHVHVVPSTCTYTYWCPSIKYFYAALGHCNGCNGSHCLVCSCIHSTYTYV